MEFRFDFYNWSEFKMVINKEDIQTFLSVLQEQVYFLETDDFFKKKNGSVVALPSRGAQIYFWQLNFKKILEKFSLQIFAT